MKINVKNINEEIQTARPSLKTNTVKQYESNLNKLKKMFESDNWDFLNNPEKVEEKISHLHFTSRRNHYNAIIVLLMALNSDNKYDKILAKYDEMRNELNEEYNKQSSTISDKQSKNFASMEEINEMISKVGEELKSMKLKQKENLNKKEMALLQFFVLVNLYKNIPLRNDVSYMEAIKPNDLKKMTKEEQKEKNWLLMEKNKLSIILNNYKSDKTYGQKIIPIEDKDLKRLLNYYIKIIGGKGVLFKSSTGTALSPNALTQFFLKYTKKYLGKSVSTTLMRKAVASHHFGEGTEFAKLKQQQKDMSYVMGNSPATMDLVYIKKKKDESSE
jgi:hypothetical protein